MLTVNDSFPVVLPLNDLAVALGPPAATSTLPAGIRSTLAEGGRDPRAPGAVQFVFIKSKDRATKTYRTGPNGRPDKAADPFLSEGTVYRASLSGAAPLSELAGVLDNMPSDGVLMCGTLADHRDAAPLTTKERLASRPGAIARTKDCATYPAGLSGLAMIDHDAKDLPDELCGRLAAAGGLDAVLASVCPEFGQAGILTRPSVSTGIRAIGTGHATPGGGRHIYFVAEDGADIPDFIKRLHQHLVLHGWGWVLTSKDGRCHIRSLIDTIASGNPYWLAFEADAVLEAGLEYVPGARACVVERDGAPFDTTTLPELTPAEAAQLASIQSALLAQAEPAAKIIRDKVIAERMGTLVDGGMDPDKARERVTQAFVHQRLDTAERVKLDDGRTPTIVEILRNPAVFHKATGADPLEPDYGGGRNKAIYYTDGRYVRCHSHAHGGQLFELGYTAKDLIAAWTARRDLTEIAGMWEQTLLNDLDTDLVQLAKAGVPTWQGLDFGRAALDDLPRLVNQGKWCELAILKGQLRGVFADKLADAIACGVVDGAAAALGIAAAEAMLAGAGAIPAGWVDGITRGKGGQAQPTLSNALAGLGQGCGLTGHLRLDRAVGLRVMTGVPPGSAVWDALGMGEVAPLYVDPLTGFPVLAWSDTLLTSAMLHLERSGAGLTNRSHAEHAAAKIAEAGGYSSVARYLRGLVWDGTPRLDGWFVRHAGAEDTGFNRVAPARWMLGAVARALYPEERGGPAQMDTALVLAGAQGAGKSQFFRVLSPVPRWHTESSLGDLAGKDALIQLASHWLVDLAEGSSVKANAVESFKQFLTATTDNYRPLYERNPVSLPRRVAFGMTVNPDGAGFLRDSTGNRRLWVVEVEAIDIAQLRQVRDQLWAEAVACFDAGERWWFERSDPHDAALEAEGAAAAEGHRVQTTVETVLRRYIEEKPPSFHNPSRTAPWEPRPVPLTVMGALPDVLREIGQERVLGSDFGVPGASRALHGMGWVSCRPMLRDAPVDRGRSIWVNPEGAAALRDDKRRLGAFSAWLEGEARAGRLGLRSGAGLNAEWFEKAGVALPGDEPKPNAGAEFTV